MWCVACFDNVYISNFAFPCIIIFSSPGVDVSLRILYAEERHQSHGNHVPQLYRLILDGDFGTEGSPTSEGDASVLKHRDGPIPRRELSHMG